MHVASCAGRETPASRVADEPTVASAPAAAAVSPTVASAGSHRITARNADRVVHLRTLESPFMISPEGLSFSSDGVLLAAHDHLWRVADGAHVGVLQGGGGGSGVAFSPDDAVVACGFYGETLLFEVPAGRRLFWLPGGADDVAYSPDGQLVATAGYEGAQVWRIRTADAMLAMEKPGRAEAVAFSPDGKMLAAGVADTVKLWRVADGGLMRTFQGHSSSVGAVAFSSDGRMLASGSFDGTARLWRVSDGRDLRVLRHDAGVEAVAFSAGSDVIATAGRDRTVRLWRVSDGKELGLLAGHTDRLLSVAFSPDGETLASASHDNTVRLWAIGGQRQPTPAKYDIRMLPVITASNATGIGLLQTVEQPGWVHRISFSPDGLLLAAGVGSVLQLRQVADGAQLRELAGHRGPIHSIAFAQASQLIATGAADYTARAWRLADGAQVAALRHAGSDVRRIAISPNGQNVATISTNETVSLWRVADGALLHTLDAQASHLLDVRFAPDGQAQLLAQPFDENEIGLWSISQRSLLRVFSGLPRGAQVTATRFSNNGELLAAGLSTGAVLLWRASDASRVQRIVSPSPVESLAFSPDDELIAAGQHDRVVRLWRISDGALLQSLKGHTNAVNSVAFSRDGRVMATGSNDNTLRYWGVR